MKSAADAPLGLTWANGPTSVRARLRVGADRRHRRLTDARHPRRRGAAVDRDDPHARRHRAAWLPAHRRGRRGRLVAARSGRTRTWESFRARVGALGAAVDEPQASASTPRRDPLGDDERQSDDGRCHPLGAARRRAAAIVEDAWVRVRQGRVAATGTGDGWRRSRSRTTVVDAVADGRARARAHPGFIDIHGHGGAGASYDDGAEAIRTARAMHRAHGTTRAVISLVTAPLDDLERRVADRRRPHGDGCRHPRLAPRGAVPRPGPPRRARRRRCCVRPSRRPSSACSRRARDGAAGDARARAARRHSTRSGSIVAAGAAAAVGHTGAD